MADKHQTYLERVRVMAKSGKYADFSDIEIALILEDVTDSHEEMTDDALRSDLNDLCKKAKPKKP